jgi:hydroxymethylbilane synthase
MMLAAMLPRVDARDAFISGHFANVAELAPGARIGTSSLRRQCQLRQLRSDIEIVPLRGNVDTRLRKLDAGEFDAIILASAGLIRLGLGERITQFLPIDQSLPAVGQGIIGIECRADDTTSLQYIGVLNDPAAQICITAERGFAHRLEGSCQSPIAGYAELSGASVKLQGLIASIDGRQVFRDSIVGSPADAESLGRALADRMLFAGADKLLQELRGQLPGGKQ